jgi:hypothetical protein
MSWKDTAMQTFLCKMSRLCCLMLGICFRGCTDLPSTAQPVAATSQPDIVQPTYDRWQQIKVGMTETQVEALLGKPLERTDPDWWKREIPPTGPAHCIYSATYGRIRFTEPEFAHASFEYVIEYCCADHTVNAIADPFDGRLSTDGKPVTPALIYPFNGQRFSHYPRLMDFRWTPSSGEYPIEYELQLLYQAETDTWGGPTTITRTSSVPHVVESWVGKNTGVWRVRAKNKLGTSAWSEERTFDFTR